MSELPDWVGQFLNRRTEVEGFLRRRAKAELPVTPFEAKQLANFLSMPADVSLCQVAAKALGLKLGKSDV